MTNEEEYQECYICRELKPLEDFKKDKRTPSGYGYKCKECHRKQFKAQYHKSKTFKHAKREHPPRRLAMMTNDAFNLYYYDRGLRGVIKDYARQRAKGDGDLFKDYCQIAWGEIARCESGLSIEYYMMMGKRAIKKSAERKYNMKYYDITYEETMSKDDFLSWKNGAVSPDMPIDDY